MARNELGMLYLIEHTGNCAFVTSSIGVKGGPLLWMSDVQVAHATASCRQALPLVESMWLATCISRSKALRVRGSSASAKMGYVWARATAMPQP